MAAFLEVNAVRFVPGVTPEVFAQLYPHLYHMAHDDAWAQIQRFGLLSTRSILDRWQVDGPLRTQIETQIRRTSIELSHPHHGKIVLRDQKPMYEKKLRAALTDCTPEEWCQLLNGKVFFWPSIKRLHTHMYARENRGKKHLVLTIDSCRFAAAYEKQIKLCPMNSGNTIPFSHKRGKNSFMKLNEYPFQQRRARGACHTVAELAVDTDIPDILDFVTSVDYMVAESGGIRPICQLGTNQT